MTQPILEIDAIKVRYSGLPVLQGVSLHVAVGETVSVLGSNGAGKSTLLRAVMGAQPDGWLLYTAHGLDGEGWGPLRSTYLEGLLERLLQRADARILPTPAVLDTAMV